MKTIITILLTSLFWIVLFYCFGDMPSVGDVAEQPCVDSLTVEQVEAEETETIVAVPVGQYGQVLVGEWEPTDKCDDVLVMTKYGTMEKGYRKNVYRLSGNKVRYGYDSDFMTDGFKIEISQSETKYYLEIYNDRDYAGRYQRLK